MSEISDMHLNPCLKEKEEKEKRKRRKKEKKLVSIGFDLKQNFRVFIKPKLM